MIKPIAPDDIPDAKKNYFPDEVIEVWNEIIAKNYNSGSATIYQKEIAQAIATKLLCDIYFVYRNKYLDVEDVYRAEGWSVTYDKPGYNESYEAYFIFKRKK